MEQPNQRISRARSSRKPLLLFWLFCVVVVSLGAYASFQRSSPQDSSSHNDDEFAPDIEYGRAMSKRLSELEFDHRSPSENISTAPQEDSDANFWDDYLKYLSLYEEKEPAKPKEQPQEKPQESRPVSAPVIVQEKSEPTLEEQLQAQLRAQRASALLTALKSSSTVSTSSNAVSLLAQQAGSSGTSTGTGTGYAANRMASGEAGMGTGAQGPNTSLTPQQQLALQHSKAQLQGMGMNGTGSGGFAGGAYNPNSQHTLDAYQSLVNNDTLLKTNIETVLSPFLLRQGALLPCVLLTGINSDLPGLVQAQVTEDVFDTPQGQHLLIPRGSKLIGQYASAPLLGQERLMLAFNRVIFPDGKAMNLGAMPASSPDGYAGMDSEVDTHFWRLMGNAILLGGVTAGISISVDDDVRDDDGNLTLNGALSQGLGQSMGRVLTNVIERNMNISPTLNVHPGFLFNVTLTKDIYFPSAYQAYAY